MNPTIFVFFFSSLIFQASAFANDAVWPIRDGGNGHAYRVVASGDIEWEEARIEAEKFGGYLVTITSEGENSFVFELIDDPSYWSPFSGRNSGPWIGSFQPKGSIEPDGGWVWLNNEGLLSKGYENWLTGEPNNFGSENENTVNFWSESSSTRQPTWNDTNTTTPVVAYIVEFDTPINFGDINRDGTVDLLDVDAFVELLTSGDYQIEGDFNCDGFVTLLDVAGFVEAISNGG